jgi:hypothetical protein
MPIYSTTLSSLVWGRSRSRIFFHDINALRLCRAGPLPRARAIKHICQICRTYNIYLNVYSFSELCWPHSRLGVVPIIGLETGLANVDGQLVVQFNHVIKGHRRFVSLRIPVARNLNGKKYLQKIVQNHTRIF